MINSYKTALAYLSGLKIFGSNLGLQRIQKLLELMNNPEKDFKTIHVTGTNGKGSTTAMVAAMLKECGIKTGMYISPHLTDYTERMTINGQPITQEAFAEVLSYTIEYVEEMVNCGYEHPTEFEILTAAAFYYFSKSNVEYAVIEVGLGGLLDSTNVITPEVSVITNVTLEHTDRCGNTISDIAIHKAGIIKPNVPVVTAAAGEALPVIWNTAYKKLAPLYLVGRDFDYTQEGREGYKQKVSITTKTKGSLGIFKLNLLGEHQCLNSAIAVMVVLLLGEKDIRITLDAIRQGLDKVKWPARFEIAGKAPTLIIDGAHNPDGAKVLRKTLDEYFPQQNRIFVLGILRDKDVNGIISNLIRPQDEVVVVRPLSERAADPEVIAREISAKHVEAHRDISKGIEQAKKLAGDNGIICVAGSLYLAGVVKDLVCIDK